MRYGPGVITLALLLAGCAADTSGPEDGPRLVRIVPEGRLIELDGNVALEFSRPMMAGEEERVSLLRADGSSVAVTSSWSDDGRTLLLDPVEPLAAQATYTVHVIGGMHDRDHVPMRMQSGDMMGTGMMGDDCPMDSIQHANHESMHADGSGHDGDMMGDDHAVPHDGDGGAMMEGMMSDVEDDDCLAVVFTTA